MNTFLAAKYGGTVDRARPASPIISEGAVSNAWASILGLIPPDRLVVDAQSAGGLPALGRAVDLVAESVASMMAGAIVLDEAGEETPRPEIVARPYPLFGGFEFYAMMTRCLMMTGNAYAIIVEDQQIPVSPYAVTVDITSGLPVYKIGKRAFRFDEVLHLRSHADPGTFVGRGIVDRFRSSVSEQLYEQRYAESTFSSGGTPSGIISIDQTGPVTQDQTDAVDESWQMKFGQGKRKVAVLPKGLSFEPISWSPRDAEFIDGRKLSVAQAALIAGLRPEDLGASLGDSLTYSNRSDNVIERITYSFQPIAELWESALSDLVPGSVVANPESLLRMSVKESEELEGLRLDNEAKRRALAIPATPTEEVTQ